MLNMKLKTVFLLFCFYMGSYGQIFDVNYPWLTDIREPLVWNNVYSSPRTMGLSGAVSALAKDMDASFYNPALYGTVQRSRVFLNIARYNQKMDLDYFGNSSSNDISKSTISSFGMIYSYPVYRGSASFAFGYVKLKDFTSTAEFSGYTTGFQRQQSRLWEENREERRGGLSAFTIASAFQYAKDVYLGGSINFLSGENDYELSIFREDRDFAYHQNDFFYDRRFKTDSDISGVNFNLGLIYQINQNFRFSFDFQSPSWLAIDEESERYYNAEDDSMYYYETVDGWDEAVWIQDKYEYDLTLPMNLTFGVGYKNENISLGVDWTFLDYAQLDYSKSPFQGFDESRVIKKIYESGYRISGGLEFFVPGSMLVLRGGSSFETIPYKFGREAYINERDEMEFSDLKERENKISFSAGIGIYLDQSIILDAGFQTESYLYEENLLKEDFSRYSFVVGLTFRLR